MINPIRIVVDVINASGDGKLFGDLVFTAHVYHEERGVARVSAAISISII
jgi:hypothetical protein